MKDEYEQSRNALREELNAHRKRARDMMQQKDEQIASLQGKVKDFSVQRSTPPGTPGSAAKTLGGASPAPSPAAAARAVAASRTAQALIDAADSRGAQR